MGSSCMIQMGFKQHFWMGQANKLISAFAKLNMKARKD